MTHIGNNILRLNRWIKLLAGKSYYHKHQGLGKKFTPDKIEGYFNDLTNKTLWEGKTDPNGTPMNVILETRRKVYFATTIVQKALGHYDKWLMKNEAREFSEFIKLCDWLVNNQDSQGGWKVWVNMGVKALVPYSAMTQGEAISALVRAWKHTRSHSYKECAEHACSLLIEPVEKGGTAYYIGNDIFLEEIPLRPRNTILNGWIFALIGLYDYHLAFSNEKVYRKFRNSLGSLEYHISCFDTGYWSYYDTQRHIASHFYHDLHIAQLNALCLIEPEHNQILKYVKQWSTYRQHKFNLYYATILKGIQKIREPGEVTLLK